MKLKSKIYLSLFLLFGLILLLSGLGSYFLQELSRDSKAIMKDNFQTLEYMQSLSNSLDNITVLMLDLNTIPGIDKELDRELTLCDSILEKQLANITETGEHQLSSELASHFQIVKKLIQRAMKEEPQGVESEMGQILPRIMQIKAVAANIYSINKEALVRKNALANDTAERVTVYMAIFGFSGIFVALVYVLHIPNYFFIPLSKLNEGIKQIAADNYGHLLEVSSKDELGQIASSFNTMVQRLYFYNQSNISVLLAEKRRIDAIINQMHEGIIGIDESNTIIFANLMACELLNTEEEKIKDKTINTLASSNDLIKSIAESLASGDLENKTIRVVRQGKERRYTMEVIPIFTSLSGGEAPVGRGFVVVLTDITTFTEKDFAKTQFIATISHELKTPLASIMMTLKLLKDGRVGDLTQEQQELLGSIREDSDRLLRIIGELLKMAQVETGNIQLEVRPAEPGRMIDVAVQTLQQQASAKGLALHSEVKTGKWVLSDVDKTAWVLVNLLSNAIRYSPEHAEVVLTVAEEGGTMVKFSVSDKGPGIDPKYQESLFEKYFKVPGAGQTGTGLGLAISKEFIRAMGGSIGVVSMPGEGSTFWFQLPATEPATA